MQEGKVAVFTTKYKGMVMVFRPAHTDSIDGVVIKRNGEYIHFRDGEYRTTDDLKIRFIESKKDFGTAIFRLDDEDVKPETPEEENEKVTQMANRHKQCPKCGKNYTGMAYAIHERTCKGTEAKE